MGQIQSLDELISFLIRRKWIIGLVTVLGMALSLIAAKLQPDTFQAAAVIQVQGAQIAGDAAGQTGSAQILQSIEQQLTTREALLAVIDRHGLFADLPLSADQKVGLLRASIRFEGVAAAGNQTFGAPAALSAIIVFATLGDADQAARVANDFAQSMLDQSSTGAADKARETLAFFAAESARVEAEIATLDTEVAAFKNANAAALPTLVEAQRTELIALETATRDLDQDLVALTAEQAALQGAGTQRATERRRLAELTAQIAVLTDQRAALAARLATIETAIAQTPEVERQLLGYARQLTQLQEQYQVITRRKAEAETTQRLAEQQQGERFALLERAITPAYPLGSGGKKLAMAGTLISLVAAFGLAFVLDLMNPVVRTAAQMERQLGLRPVITIPELALPASGRGRGAATALPDLRKTLLALPRFVVGAGAATLVLLAVSALV